MTKVDEIDERSPGGKLFWLAFMFGCCVMAFGLWTLVQDKGLTNPKYTFELALGANIFHDAILAPAVFVSGYLVTKIVPAKIRPQFAWGLAASAIVLLVGYIPLSGNGLKADNPTLLPLNYTTSVLTVLVVIWCIVIAITAMHAIRRRRA